MYRSVLMSLALATALGATVGTGHAAPSLRDGLAERFQLSRIDVQSSPDQGHVVKRGTILRLQADGIPAHPLRTVQVNTKSPRFHVPDYARVEVDRAGKVRAAPGPLSLPKGTRLVVLDLKVRGDQVRLFTHTVDPVPLPGGKVGYGCTEFVFVLDPGARDRADVGTVAGRIDRVLARNSS